MISLPRNLWREEGHSATSTINQLVHNPNLWTPPQNTHHIWSFPLTEGLKTLKRLKKLNLSHKLTITLISDLNTSWTWLEILPSPPYKSINLFSLKQMEMAIDKIIWRKQSSSKKSSLWFKNQTMSSLRKGSPSYKIKLSCLSSVGLTRRTKDKAALRTRSPNRVCLLRKRGHL